MKQMSISQLFGGNAAKAALFPRIEKQAAFKDKRLERLFQSLPKSTQTRIINQGVGVEIEVEHAVAVDCPGWTRAADNSLRDNGIEYKTRFGQRIGHLSEILTELNGHWDNWRKTQNRHAFQFSERTSVHVHLDARNMTTDEVISLLMVYTIFEDALFGFAGTGRKDNIFCIPLRHSAMRFGDGFDFMALHEIWVKYLAVNICPLAEFGTIEFRHMVGTSDYIKIMTWVILLALMVDYVKRTKRLDIEKVIVRLKKESNYYQFLSEIFGGFGANLQMIPLHLDQAVSDAKLFFAVGTTTVAPKKNPEQVGPRPRARPRRAGEGARFVAQVDVAAGAGGGGGAIPGAVDPMVAIRQAADDVLAERRNRDLDALLRAQEIAMGPPIMEQAIDWAENPFIEEERDF